MDGIQILVAQHAQAPYLQRTICQPGRFFWFASEGLVNTDMRHGMCHLIKYDEDSMKSVRND